MSRGVQLSREIRPYVVVYFGNNGMDAKNNESRRKTKTIPVEKDKKGKFKVDIYEELWFKNEKEESGEDPSLKFVVWNRHIGDNNGNGKDSEPLYYAAIPKFEEWIANGLYLGRVQLHRYGHHDDDTKLKNCYIQVTFEVKYSKETNIYRYYYYYISIIIYLFTFLIVQIYIVQQVIQVINLNYRIKVIEERKVV